MPIPKPPEPYRTWLGRLLRSEEEADKERERIRRRRALEDLHWENYFAQTNLPEKEVMPHGADPEARTNGAGERADMTTPAPAQSADSRHESPAEGQAGAGLAASKLYDWLIGHGFRVYLKDDKVHVGPGPLSKTLRGAVNQHLKGLRLLLEGQRT